MLMLVRTALAALAVSLLAASCPGSSPVASAPPAAAGAAARAAEAPAAPPHPELVPTDPAALERALETVEAARLKADVEFLASDELEGRDSPSAGLRIAARFIRARLVRLGWLPGASDGYFHHYRLDYPVLDLEATWAELRPSSAGPGADEAPPRRLGFGRDYWFHPGGATTSRREGALVFCGGGSDEELASIDVTGRVALCLDGGMHWRRRERNLEQAGAIGLVTVPGPAYDDAPYEERFASYVDRARHPYVSYPDPERTPRAAGIAQLFVAPRVARAVWPWLDGGEPPALGADLGTTLVDQRTLADEAGQVTMENVAGYWPGSDPELAREVIVLTAHYDHVGVRGGEIYNGADDNASGSATLMAVAEALVAYGPMRRSVLLLWVSAEEKGLWGSRAWTENPWLPDGGRAVCDINIDMVGRNAPDELHLTPTSAHPAHNGLTRLAERWSGVEGFAQLKSADDFWERSDHANFSTNLGIPVAFLFADVHEDYHKPSDTADKIDADKMRRVARLVLRMLDGLQADELGV